MNRLLRWARAPFAPAAPSPLPEPAEVRVMHLVGPGMGAACGLRHGAMMFVTVERGMVTCPPCKAIAAARQLYRTTNMR